MAQELTHLHFLLLAKAALQLGETLSRSDWQCDKLTKEKASQVERGSVSKEGVQHGGTAHGHSLCLCGLRVLRRFDRE